MEDGSLFTDALLPLALSIIMLSLGMTLTTADFRRILTVPKGVGIGLVNLMAISPFLAFGVAELYSLSPELAVGLVLLGASPGGAMANLLTHLARGEVALSVTMTAISSVCSVITVPLFLSLAADHFGAADVSDQIDMASIVVKVFLITIVPLSIGMRLRATRPERTIAQEPRIKKASLILFLLIVTGAVISEFETISENFGAVAAAALTLNVLAMSISFTIARVAGLPDRQATAIAMELGVHNSTLAITVAASVSSDLAIPAAVYSAFMFVTAGAFARVMARRNEPIAAQTSVQ